MTFTLRPALCYNKKVKGSRGAVSGSSLAALLFLVLPLIATAQTVDDLLASLEKAFAAKDSASYASAFGADLRDRESAAVAMFMDAWKMDQVRFHQATRTAEPEGEAGLYIQALYENPFSAILETWHVWLRKDSGSYVIGAKEVTGNITSLYKVKIPSDRVERAGFVEIKHQDIVLTFQDCWVFYDNIPGMETALLIIGKGRYRFSPSSEPERHQLQLRYDALVVDDTLEYAYLRFSDSFFRSNIRIARAAPDKTPPLPQSVSNRAYSIFSKLYASSFTIENSLTNDLLSFAPQPEQVVFEFKGGHTGEMAYIYSPFSEEGIHFMKRNPDKLVNLYSPEKEGERGGRRMFISFGQKFDVRRYDIELDFQPEKFHISARVRIQIFAQIDSVDSLKFNFNPSLNILHVNDQDGRELFYTQDKSRSLLYVYFLKPIERKTSATIEILYRGTLPPPIQTTDVAPRGQTSDRYSFVGPRYDTYLYSQSAAWYPAPPNDDHFQADLRFSVPPGFSCIANGVLTEQGILDSRRVAVLDKVGNALYRFETKYPIKYLSFLVGKLDRLQEDAASASLPLTGYVSTEIYSQRQGLLREARAIIGWYEKWFGPYPYEKLSVVQRLYVTSGGHSPASFIVLNERARSPDAPLAVNSTSPVDLSRWREYYIAHEIAHQWWGQAVAGERYRDQWLSEGLSQFAAVLYLREKLGADAYAGILKKFAKWTERKSKWGAINLGSRLSYLDFDAYQAIVYDKAALALIMLMDLLGDEAFFRGLRSYFETYKYNMARTAQFEQCLAKASGRDLKPFFEGWFDSYLLPEVQVIPIVVKQGEDHVLKFRINQTRGVFVFPLWVTWNENGTKVRRMLEINAPTQDFEFRMKAKPVRIKINPDKAVPGDFN